MPLHIVKQDITALEVDAVVNTTNEEMVGYSGVDLAIHTKGGKGFLAGCCSEAIPACERAKVVKWIFVKKGKSKKQSVYPPEELPLLWQFRFFFQKALQKKDSYAIIGL